MMPQTCPKKISTRVRILLSENYLEVALNKLPKLSLTGELILAVIGAELPIHGTAPPSSSGRHSVLFLVLSVAGLKLSLKIHRFVPARFQHLRFADETVKYLKRQLVKAVCRAQVLFLDREDVRNKKHSILNVS